MPDAAGVEMVAEVRQRPVDAIATDTPDVVDALGTDLLDVAGMDAPDVTTVDATETTGPDGTAPDTASQEILESPFLLVGGHEAYSFDTKDVDDDVARLVQILRDSGPEFVAAYATMFDWPYADGQLRVWFRPPGDERSGDLTAQDLLDIGATVIVGNDEATWFKVPLEGLSQLFDNMDITSMNGLEIPKGIDLKPLDGLAAVGMDEALEAIGAPDCHQSGITGKGVRVAVIDGGFLWYEAARDAGLLPENVHLVQDYNFTPPEEMTSAHGTACAEIIHQTAPDAELFLIPVSHTKFQTPNAVQWCTENGIDVINASWSSFNQSFYDGTGFVSELVQQAMDAGIVWVNSSGNYGSGEHWYGEWQDEDQDGVMEFSGADEENWFTLAKGQGVRIFLRWEGPDAWTTDLNICITYTRWHLDTPDDTEVVRGCSGGFVGAPKDFMEFGWNNEEFCLKDPATYRCTAPDFGVSIERAGGNPLPPGTQLSLSMFVDSFRDGQNMSYSMPENSVVDPGVYHGALTVGAINYNQWDAGTTAQYSSFGPTNSGVQKPELMAPDAVATYMYDNFYGTSASAPFVAGMAALVREFHPDLVPLDVKDRLMQTAIPLADALPDPVTGYGKLHYDCSDCEPQCGGLECGPDPNCGAECGTCTECGEVCQNGQCVFAGCDGKVCGDDGCGSSCGECPVNHNCQDGQCLCKLPLVCGDFCCNDGEICFMFECCIANCEGKACGSDDCGGVCGFCSPGETCGQGVCSGTFQVNSADDTDDGQCDDDHCSLREALTAANAKAGADTIRFDIPGAGPHVIAVQSALPDVEETLVLDGTSEPDYNGKPVVVIDGSGLNNGESGLVVLAHDSEVKGLAIGGFPELGMLIALAQNVSVTGCHIGTDAEGTSALANGSDGLRLNVASNAHIGCAGAGCTNILSGNGGDGLEIQQSSGVVVEGNIIGVDATGLAKLGNGETGINFVLVTDCTIGGDTLQQGNLIGGNGWEGISVAGAGNTDLAIVGNLIGSDPNGLVDLGNTGAGIAFYADTSDHLVSSNVIAYNGGAGVLLDDWGVGPPQGVAILGNTMHSNLGTTIDLGSDGHTPNDAGDGDDGCNTLQNYPDLDVALVGDASTTVHGTLDSQPDTWYRLEFFENPTCGKSGYGEATSYLGYFDVQTDGTGQVSFKAPLAGEVTLGATVSATATPFDADTDAFGGTSEVSACATISQD
jgi:CSLREA domain-containing protein